MRIRRDRYPDVHKDSVRIWDVLEKSVLYRNAQSIFTYISCGSEVETYFTLDQIRRQGKQFYLPRIQEGGRMDFYGVENIYHMERNRYGIYEPSMREQKKEPDAHSLMLVPGLAFDLSGERIGYGRGYYDRYLQRFPELTTVGLCYDFQITAEPLPADDTDRKLQYLISPRGLYSVEKGAWL